MGGNVGQAIAEAGLGFMQGYADTQFKQQMQRKATQDQYAFNAGQELANRGELENLPPDMLKPLQRMYGKEGFAQLMQLNKVNQFQRQLRLGAERMVQAPIAEERVAQSPELQGPPTPQGELPKYGYTVNRAPTPEEQYQRYTQMDPLGVALTGGIDLGQLAHGNVTNLLRAKEHELDVEKERTKVSKTGEEEIIKLQSNLAEKGVRNAVVDPDQAAQILQTPEAQQRGLYPFIVGGKVVLIEPTGTGNFGEKADRYLAEMGIKDPSRATPQQLAEVNRRIFDEDMKRGAVSEMAKKEASMSMPVVVTAPNVASQYYDPQTGEPYDRTNPAFSLNDIVGLGKKNIVRLTDQQIKDLDGSKKFYADWQNLKAVTDKLFAPGGPLHGKDKNFLSRLRKTGESVYQQFIQSNPDLVMYARMKGQMAQAFNRGEYGGVGTQTEQDRKYSTQLFPQEGARDALVDTPEVAARLMNSMGERILKNMRITLGNKDYVPGAYTGETQPGEPQAPAEQPAQGNIPSFEDVQKQDPSITRDVYNAYIQSLEGSPQAGQKKNLEGAAVTPQGRQLLAEFEGMRTEMYDDATGETIEDASDAKGYATIGIGHLLTRAEQRSGKIDIAGEQVDYRNGLTEEQVFALLDQDTQDAAEIVDKYVTVELTPEQRDALISFAFNIGEGNFKNAGAIKALNRGDVEEFLKRHAQWNKSKGKEMRGLTRRREQEANLFTGALHG